MVLLCFAAGAGPAGAATPEDDSITWSIKPVPAENGSERASFTPQVEPGQTISDSIRVRVLGASPIAFQIYASDAFITATGGFDLLAGSEQPKDLGSWVEMSSPTVLVAPGEAVDVPFTIRVPANATPGDHVGGIVTSLTTTATADGGVPIRVERRLGSRIYLRVFGPLEPKLEITEHKIEFEGVWNLFGKGSVQTSYTVANTGNVRLKARQSVELDGLIGDRSGDLPDLPELLPGSTLELSEQTAGIFPTGRLKQTLTLDPYPSAEGEVLEPAPVALSSSATIFALPYTILLFALVAAAALTLSLRRRRHSRQDGTSKESAGERL